MTDKDKENQDEHFIFDSKEMEKLASYDPPIEQLRKEKEKLKKKRDLIYGREFTKGELNSFQKIIQTNLKERE